jgi:hypothetical protein
MEKPATDLVRQILRSPLFLTKSTDEQQATLDQILATGEITREDLFNLIVEEQRIQQLNQNVQPIAVQPQRRPHGRIMIGQTVRTLGYPSAVGFEVISAWSRGKAPWKNLSPFYLGPVNFESWNGPDSSAIFENFYQSFKVWQKVDKQTTKDWKWPAEVHVDVGTDVPNTSWYNWHNALLHHNQPVRRPNGKAVPLFAWWYDPTSKQFYKLDTIMARKVIYIPFLKALYRQHPTYQQLLQKFRGGQNIMLVEPDGPLRDAYPNGREFDLPTLYQWIDKMNYGDEGFPNSYSPFGHGYVLATCLLEDSQQ